MRVTMAPHQEDCPKAGIFETLGYTSKEVGAIALLEKLCGWS